MMRNQDQILDSFRRSLRGAKTRLLGVRTDREAQEVARPSGWTRNIQVISRAEVTASAEFDIPLAALPDDMWLEIDTHGHLPRLELVGPARPQEGIDVLAVCLDDSDDLMRHLVLPELEFYPICQTPGWAELQQRWSYRGRLTATRSALRCHLLIDLKAS